MSKKEKTLEAGMRKVRVLWSTANALNADCPEGHGKIGELCYSTHPFVCPKRRDLFAINRRGEYTTVTVPFKHE